MKMKLNEAISKLKNAGLIVEYMSAMQPSQLLPTEKMFREFARDLNANVFPAEDWEYEVRALNRPKDMQSCIEIKLKDKQGHTLNVGTIDYFNNGDEYQFSISPTFKPTMNYGELPKDEEEWDFMADQVVNLVDEFIQLKKQDGVL